MERLNLGGCFRLTDAAATALATYCPNLTHLSLFQCFKLSDRGLNLLIQKLPNLQHLDLHGCMALTGSILRTLTEIHAVDVIPSLDLDSPVETNFRVSSPILRAADSTDGESDGSSTPTSASSPDLGSLSPPDSPLLAPAPSPSLKVFTFGLPQLKSLDLGSIRKISAADIQAFRKARPDVHVVRY